MISRPMPKAKKSPRTAKTRATVTHHRPLIERIVHELINQLSVLNLIGSKVIAKNDARSASSLAAEGEIFEGSLREATLLAEQLAHCVASQRGKPSAERGNIKPDPGQVVRLLRSVPRTDR